MIMKKFLFLGTWKACKRPINEKELLRRTIKKDEVKNKCGG